MMNQHSAEEDDESLSSPILTTTHSPSILDFRAFRTSKSEFEHEDSNLCSPILDQNKIKKSKSEKSSDSFRSCNVEGSKSSVTRKISNEFNKKLNISHESDRYFSTKKSTKNDNQKSATRDKRSAAQLEIEDPLQKSPFSNFKKFHSAASNNGLNSKKDWMFSHRPSNDVTILKDSFFVNDEDPPVHQSGKEIDSEKNETMESYSPELQPKWRTLPSPVSPEIKTMKTHRNFMSSHKKKFKYNDDSKRSSISVSNQQQNVGRSFNEGKQCKLLKNIVGNFNTKESAVDLKSDHSAKNDSLNINQSNPFHASLMINNFDKTDLKTKKRSKDCMNNIGDSHILSKNKKFASEVSKNTLHCASKTESVQQADLTTSPILKTKSLTSKKGQRKFNDEKGLGFCPDPKSLVIQNDSTKESVRTHQLLQNVSKLTNAMSNNDPEVFSFKWSSKKKTHLRPETNAMVSPPSKNLVTSTQSKNPICYQSPTNGSSRFSEKFSELSEAVSSSSGAKISTVRKRISFNSSIAEKRKRRAVKPVLRLNLKKKNNLENQFSKFSEFCKLNTSLSTKSPSNLTIRRSKMKKFDKNKVEESSLRKNFNSSENCCDFDRSPSPILESSLNLEPKIDTVQDKFYDSKKQEVPFKKYSPNDEISSREHEYHIEDDVNDNSLSPCLKRPKDVDNTINSSIISSKFCGNKEKPSKKFKFSLQDEMIFKDKLDNGKKFDVLKESLSPILAVQRNSVSDSHRKCIPFNIDVNKPNPHTVEINDVIDTTVVDINDESVLDDKQILNETVLERNQEIREDSQDNTVIDDVIISQVPSVISKTDQGSMTIEASESSGTQVSRISEVNLPCDNVNVEDSTHKIPSTPQLNPPLNNDDIFESGKKRKRRYKNGTLSARLNKLLNRTRSEARMWAHEQQDDLSNSVAIDLVVDIVSYEMNKWLLKCRIISESVEGDSRNVYFVILHPSAINKALISPGIVLKVFPKWQSLDLSTPKVTVIFNITRVKIIQDTLSAHSSNSALVTKQNIQVAEAFCSCPRDSVCTTCVHSLLRRQILLGPLVSFESGK